MSVSDDPLALQSTAVVVDGPKEMSDPVGLQQHEEEEADEVNENVDTKLYCICRSFYDEERMMIACDLCDDWYHMQCMHMQDDEADLVDIFVCPNCEAESTQRTTWKPKCLREECRHAALRPLSRYCSERCGVLMAAHRIGQAKSTHILVHANGFARGKAQQQLDKAWLDNLTRIPRIASAQRREGIVLWADETNETKDRLAWVGNLLGDEAAKYVCQLATQRNGQAPRTDAAPADEFIPAFPQLVELAQLHVQLEANRRDQALVNATLDVLAARVKLLHLAEDRLATLEPIVGEEFDASVGASSAKLKKKAKKSKSLLKTSDTTVSIRETSLVQLAASRGQPRCGYDERLHWDEVRFRAWCFGTTGKAILEEEEPLDGALSESMPTHTAARSPEGMETDDVQDPNPNPDPSPTPFVCALSKRKCKRHGDWSVVRGADFDTEREQQTQRLATLAHDAQQIEIRIEQAQRHLKQSLLDELDRLRQADERMAYALANEGTRRSVPQ